MILHVVYWNVNTTAVIIVLAYVAVDLSIQQYPNTLCVKDRVGH